MLRISTRALFLCSVSCFAASSVSAQDEEPLFLGTLQIEAESDETLLQNGYVAESGRQATKLDTPIAEIPQAISIVTQDQIEDQKPRQLLEALGYSAGTSTSNFAFDQRYDAFYLRGFSAFNNGLFRDGLRQVNGPSAWYRNDPYTMEGIAILKGPSSSLYGVSGPGGLVNVVSKRPKEQSFNEVRLTGGTDDMAELAFDVTGPASEDGRFLYRLTGIARDANSPYPNAPDDELLIAPAFTLEFTEKAKITFLGEYSDSTVGGTYSYYNPSYGSASEIANSDPDYNDFDQTQYRLGYEYEQELTEMVTFRQKLRYSDVDSDIEYSGFYDTGLDSLARYWGHYIEDQHNFTVDNTLESSFRTGEVDHDMIFGIDYTDSSYNAYLAPTGYVSAGATDAADADFYASQDTEQLGLYVHDQLSRGALNVFASARYDWVDTTTEDASRTVIETSASEFSGRLGVSHEMENGMTPFANISSAFVPNTGLVFDDPSDPGSSRPADPTRAFQKEIGVKYAIPGTESLITASIFDIEQDDGVVFQNVDAADFGVQQVQVPYNLRSRGFEIEGEANFQNGLRMIASYTYIDMEIEDGVAGTEGNQLSATPHNEAAIWAFYQPQVGPLGGFGIGGGLRYVGESYGDDANSFKNDDYVFADLALTYDLRRIGHEGAEIQVNVKNLFDETGQTCSAGYCYRHDGRTATAALQYRF